MYVLIPKIENLKPRFIIEAIDAALQIQPLPVEFNDRLFELRRMLVSRYDLNGNHDTKLTEPEDNKAMVSGPGGIDLSSNNFNIIEYGQDIHMDFNNKAYDYINPDDVIGIRPIIVSVSEEKFAF